MARRMTLSVQGIGESMRHPGVRAALANEAERIARNARSIYSAEGMNATVRTSNGTRPTRRPYSRIESDNADAEFGTSKTARRRVLGRAAEQGN